ncbi:MAG: Rne/Rng family ribonuclease [Euzebya sp.]
MSDSDIEDKPQSSEEGPSDSGKVERTRVRRRSVRGRAADPFAVEPSSAPAVARHDSDTEGEDGDSGGQRGRRRRRGRGGRGGAKQAEAGEQGQPSPSDTADEVKPQRKSSDTETREGSDDGGDDGGGRSGRRRRRGRRGRGRRVSEPLPAPKDEQRDTAAGSTRLTARSQRSGGRRRVPTLSVETRRVMAESPPKRMLVTVGTERTQIAVLEERTLVEHYVTQASEQSYVGNIYTGRVQNVLPGMEAAFIDIGKGRNGVLYAGEVNYDEADREGGLPRIEQALKPGQSVLVQVTKDPMGSKGARLTQHLSLAGRYCVLAPGDDMLGISRKLPDDQRDRLRKVLKDIKPVGYGLIVRTAAETATAEQLQADVERLVQRWTTVEEKAAKAGPLESIYAEPQLVLRVIRDVFGPEHTQLIIDDVGLADQVREYLQEVSPEHVDKVVTYQGDGKLFDAYEITTQIRRALEKKVWLKSGGYLIVEKTEAMWVIDVNTGKFVGKDNLEETVLRNNIEAAEEIARQLRLRDMGGIIVIDFVDMIVPANRDEVLKRFKRELARDKTKSRVMEISKLGLVQMTRKNVSKGLMESFTEETDDVIPGRRIVEDLLA